jgi:alkaline phosphatase D
VSLTRRRLLTGAVALGATHAVGPLTRRAGARPRLSGPPFTLGVASGYPSPSGVALWTRLAPAPLQPGGGMPPEVVGVEWEGAPAARRGGGGPRGPPAATPEWAHAVHVEVDGLQPGRWYWYRFHVGGESSAIARTRTAPSAGAAVERLRFAYASCQQYEQGYYGAYHRMLADDLDLVVHLGDYVYESSWGRDHVRTHGAPEPHTLEDYRIRHALYKTDPDLQAAHAACPWIFTWDDHEVANDYADDRSQHAHPREWFLARRAAAYKAYYEHMPLRRQMVPLGPHMRLYHRVPFGSLAQFHLLDDRQFRSHQPCLSPGRGGSTIAGEDCLARLDPRLSLLGDVQERWLETSLARSRARWNVLAQQSIMAQLDRKPGPDRGFWTDSWDGYPAARRRLLDYLAARTPSNPVVIGGDVHAFWVTDLRPDFDDPKSSVVATEIVGTSITSQGWRQDVLDAQRADNSHVRFADGTKRGYVRVEVTPQQWRADLRAMRTVTQPRAECDTLATFLIADGRPGAVRA